MRIAGRNDQDRAKPIQTDREGRLITVSKNDDDTVFLHEEGVTPATSYLVDVEEASTLVMYVSVEPTISRGIVFLGRYNRGEYVKIPVIDHNRILRTDDIIKEGIYYVDVSMFDEVNIRAVSSSYDGVLSYTTTTVMCPQAIDAPVKYKRITTEDGLVKGQFRAIEPITDITLHEQTRLSQEYSDSQSLPELSQFETGDGRVAGQTLFGPFSQVRLYSGSAWLVLL